MQTESTPKDIKAYIANDRQIEFAGYPILCYINRLTTQPQVNTKRGCKKLKEIDCNILSVPFVFVLSSRFTCLVKKPTVIAIPIA